MDDYELLFLHKDNQKLIKYFYLLNNINTIGLQESKFYNDIISSQLSSKSRVMLFFLKRSLILILYHIK